MDATQIFQYLANGVVFGAILALGAIGLSLVYGILGLSNFAHGDLLTFGAFMALYFGFSAYAGATYLTTIALVAGLVLVALAAGDLFVTKRLTRAERGAGAVFGAILAGWGLFLQLAGPGGTGTTDRILILATFMSVLATVVLVLTVEIVIWRPLRRKRATLLTLVIVSVGLAIIIRNGLQQQFGGDYKAFSRPQLVADSYFGILISPAQQLTILLAVVLIGAVHLLLRYTRTGKSMRAVADNLDLARVSGIDVDRVVLYVWAIAGALVAVAGVLLTLVQNNYMHVNMGFALIIPLFASVVLGGIGSPYGAMFGGLAVGIAMKTSPLWLGLEYEVACAFIILTLMLFVRPQGLFGVKQ